MLREKMEMCGKHGVSAAIIATSTGIVDMQPTVSSTMNHYIIMKQSCHLK